MALGRDGEYNFPYLFTSYRKYHTLANTAHERGKIGHYPFWYAAHKTEIQWGNEGGALYVSLALNGLKAPSRGFSLIGRVDLLHEIYIQYPAEFFANLFHNSDVMKAK